MVVESMKPFLRRLAAVVGLTALCLSASAQTSSQSNRSALIVGVSTYASPDIPSLRGVGFDVGSARQIAAAMGIPDSRITVLRDAEATKAGILAALDRLASTVGEGGRVFVYFSGHGTRWFDPQVNGCKEGLLAYDQGTITNEEIAQRTRRVSETADKVMMFFDACHSDGVSVNRNRTRSLAGTDPVTLELTPKFFIKGSADNEVCSRPANVRTRSLLAEASRLGALSENFVQITSARADEVSFDDPNRGGLATQGVRDCLLGAARDLDASGAVSIREIEQCAQSFVEQRLAPFPSLQPHHITVTGNRNLVPAPSRPPMALAAAAPSPAPVAQKPPAPVVVNPAPAPVAAPAPAPVAVAPATPPPAASPPPPPPPPPPPAAPVDPGAAALATLREIEAQQNPRRKLDVTLSRSALRIGKDPLELRLKSSHDGHVYLVLLGSDRESFYVLFPNGLDRNNRIQADKPLNLPRPEWAITAKGPPGVNNLLVLVSDSPRDLSALTRGQAGALPTFSSALNTLNGRGSLIDLFTGQGLTGGSEAFAARLLRIEEIR
ncbi:MAG: caspase family protein [Betaproteobacteria bacterium]|nr:caspase family protein [Betaproteobacteria bacterium]